MNVWVTLGCFNLFVRIDATSKGQQAERELLAWAKREKIPYEKWTVKNGEVGQATTYSLPNAYPINLIKELLALSKVGDDIPAIRMTLQEYCALVASAATRSSIILPTLYIEVQQVAERIKQVFEKYNEGKLIPLEVHSMLISMNAALSRFSSQALSGTPPIIGTECHYWTHSLLGTGSANIALATLVRHIHRVLGEARIPERIAALKTRTDNVPDLDRLTSGPDLLSVDHIKITTPIGDGGPIAPLVTYFSGRDGFSSHLQTLSAPLTCIGECNSYRSNLMTVTHEISHIFMQGVLAQLYPNFDDITGISELQEMARPHFQATNWYDAVRQLLVEAIISMEQVRKGHANEMSPEDIVPTPNSLAKLLSYWRREAQEIMVYPDSARIRRPPLAKRRDPDSTEWMIRPGFLDIESRQNLIELARDGSAAHRLARRANALVLLDDGMSCEAIAKVLLLDDDTIRTWYRLYEGDGIEGLTNFSYEGSACQLSGEQQEKLKAWVATALPRTTRQVGAWIENEFGVVYEGRSGLIALLHRLGLEYHKPNVIPRKLDEEKQRAFIEGYEKLLNSLGDDEAVLFADAVHPTHAARPVGCWAPSQEKLAIEQTSGRQRINIHGAIDLETGQTRMIEALTIDAASTIRLLQSIEALYPMLALIHVFLDNARYHHAKLVQEWLALPGRRIKLHFIPTYCPHLNPIERLWGLMHRNVTHNKCYATCAQFADATLSFLREKVPGNWADLCDSVTDNFRIINPKDFRVMT